MGLNDFAKGMIQFTMHRLQISISSAVSSIWDDKFTFANVNKFIIFATLSRTSATNSASLSVRSATASKAFKHRGRRRHWPCVTPFCSRAILHASPRTSKAALQITTACETELPLMILTRHSTSDDLCESGPSAQTASQGRKSDGIRLSPVFWKSAMQVDYCCRRKWEGTL